MGPYQGGQAEYVRVPFADYNALKLPPGKEHEDDFALLADIFPTVGLPCLYPDSSSLTIESIGMAWSRAVRFQAW